MTTRFVRPFSNPLPGLKRNYPYQVIDENAGKYLIKNELGREEWYDKSDLYPDVSRLTISTLVLIFIPLTFMALFFTDIFEIYYPSGLHYYLDTGNFKRLMLAFLFGWLIPYASAIIIFINWGEVSTIFNSMLIKITRNRLIFFGVTWIMIYLITATSGIATLNSDGLTSTHNLFSIKILSWNDLKKSPAELHIFDRKYKSEVYVEYNLKIAGIDLVKQSTKKRAAPFNTGYTDDAIKLLIENKVPIKYSITSKAEEMLKNPSTVKYEWQTQDIYRMLTVIYNTYQKNDMAKANQFRTVTNGLLRNNI